LVSTLQKMTLDFVFLTGQQTHRQFLRRTKLFIQIIMDTADLMEWFETQLSLIIDKHKPNQISHKISLNLTTLDQIRTSCYPQAILNLLAKKKKYYCKRLFCTGYQCDQIWTV
jgi:hypothetical protein